MSERTDEVERDLTDYDAELVDGADLEEIGASSRSHSIGEEFSIRESHTSSEGGLRSRLATPLTSLFSVRWFGAATVASLVGVFLAGGIPLPFSGYLGVLLAAGAVGLVGSERHYVEVAIAGAIAAALAVFFDVLLLVFIGVGIPLVGVAAVLGAVVGVVGHYLGRDLRDGLTRDL